MTIEPDCWDAQDKQATQYPPTPKLKKKDAPTLLKFRGPIVPLFGYGYHEPSGQRHGTILKNWWVPLKKNVYGHQCAGLLWKIEFEKVFSGKWMGEGANLFMPFCASSARSISVCVRRRH